MPSQLLVHDTKQASDLSRINLGGAGEADYWTHELGVSNGELMRIIGKVGNSVMAVCKELALKRPGSSL